MTHIVCAMNTLLQVFLLTPESRIRERETLTLGLLVFLRLSVRHNAGNSGKNKESKENEEKYTTT